MENELESGAEHIVKLDLIAEDKYDRENQEMNIMHPQKRVGRLSKKYGFQLSVHLRKAGLLRLSRLFDKRLLAEIN